MTDTRMRLARLALILASTGIVLAACAPLVQPQQAGAVGPYGQPMQNAVPATQRQNIAMAYSRLTSAYMLVADLAQRQRLSRGDAVTAIRQLDEVRAAMEYATTMGDMNALTAATQGLIAVEQALRQREQQANTRDAQKGIPPEPPAQPLGVPR